MDDFPDFPNRNAIDPAGNLSRGAVERRWEGRVSEGGEREELKGEVRWGRVGGVRVRGARADLSNVRLGNGSGEWP